MIRGFTHRRATTVDEALRAIASGATPYAGGTELLAAMKLGLLAPTDLVDLKTVPELVGIEQSGTGVTIGAATPHAVVEAHRTIRDLLPVLAEAVKTVGNPRVRWQGTVGGNLCFAEPRSDLIPVLVALDAELHLRSEGGDRFVPAESFVLDAFTVDRREDELLLAMHIESSGLDFQRYFRTQHMERPTVGVAIVRRAGVWRLCVGSVAYVPSLHTAPDLDAFDAAAIAAGLEPIEDASGSAEYKRHLTEVLVSRAIATARAAR